MSGWNDQYRDPRLIPDRLVRMMPAEERRRLGRHCKTQEERQECLDIKAERQLHGRIESLLRIREIAYVHARMDKPSTIRKGWPDFSFALNGKAIAIEVKKPGEEPTIEQVQCIMEMQRNGWFVRVVRSEAEFLQALADAEKSANPDRL